MHVCINQVAMQLRSGLYQYMCICIIVALIYNPIDSPSSPELSRGTAADFGDSRWFPVGD